MRDLTCAATESSGWVAGEPTGFAVVVIGVAHTVLLVGKKIRNKVQGAS
jgi:hypothetical protein